MLSLSQGKKPMVPPMRLVSLPILGKSGLGRAAIKLPPVDEVGE